MTTERDEFLNAGLVPMACRSCGTTVLAAKRSPQHTSIQWLGDATRSCPVLAERAGSARHRVVFDGCENLRASIALAAREGAFADD